jgi:hypothetical protein
VRGRAATQATDDEKPSTSETDYRTASEFRKKMLRHKTMFNSHKRRNRPDKAVGLASGGCVRTWVEC